MPRYLLIYHKISIDQILRCYCKFTVYENNIGAPKRRNTLKAVVFNPFASSLLSVLYIILWLHLFIARKIVIGLPFIATAIIVDHLHS